MIMLEGRRRPNNSGERGTSRDNRSDHARRTAILDCRAAINWGALLPNFCAVKFYLPDGTTLVTMQPSSGASVGCIIYEYRRNHPKLQTAKMHVSGLYRKAHWPAALLSFACGVLSQASLYR